MRTLGRLPLSEFELPAKRYFTISEVSELCQVKAHVLRYWEQEFALLNPQKRRGNRRYYTYEDIMLVRKIRRLLYDEGFSIMGARKQLSPATQNALARQSHQFNTDLQWAITELEDIIASLDQGDCP
ncbi:MAG TPA: MerR family transcriptional regulator [Marinagarivorans sp.]